VWVETIMNLLKVQLTNRSTGIGKLRGFFGFLGM
jgi:hypothetical protein